MRAGRVAVLLALPAISLIALVAVPLGLLIRISLAPSDPIEIWSAGWSLAAYERLLDASFARALCHSLAIAAVVAVISVAVSLPLAYLIARMRRRAQVAWLVFLLCTLTLSDVLIAFAWQLMLSRRVGLSQILVWAGLLDQPQSWAPSTGAMLCSLIYVVLPFTAVTLYPVMSRIDPSLLEAARTMRMAPLRAFLSVVVPLARPGLTVAFLVSFVLTLGAYVSPVMLGRPQNWTLAVTINHTALAGHDVPAAAAMSVCLLGVLAVALAAWRGAARKGSPA